MAEFSRKRNRVNNKPINSNKKRQGAANEDSRAKVFEGLFLKELDNGRMQCAASVSDFKFNKDRVKVLSSSLDIPKYSSGIVYWMSRDQRIQDNWALLYAQYLALKVEAPLHVCFCLVPKFLNATFRQYHFMLKGLQEIEEECHSLNISFHLLLGEAKNMLPQFIKDNNIGGLVTDFSPLQTPLKWVECVKLLLPSDIPFCQVDAHNIVPCWIASDKQEYSARTIRPKIHNKLSKFLTEFPPVIKHPYSPVIKFELIDWSAAESSLEVDRSVGVVDHLVPGTRAGLMMIDDFCKNRLKEFSKFRNDPTKDSLSNLSPWLHFGQISAQRCILVINTYRKNYTASVDSFVEECVIRRELADNFCFYNSDYDKIEGAYEWAKNTLKEHVNDKREYLYSCEQLEKSQTHDPLWNAAQLQMVHEGKMHGLLRMYWAKKILEWTKSPKEALKIAIYLNDRYEVDGRDPNGYVGCMWSICGIHDQGWRERSIFGKIRYMNYAGCKRKFDVDTFIKKYSKFVKK